MRAYQHVSAHPSLLAVVSGFSLRRFEQARSQTPVELPARTDLFLEFYLAEPYRVRQGGSTSLAPVMALVAPHTRPGTALLIEGRIDTFTVHFTATGCHRLYGCNMPALRDRAVLATDALGRDMLRLHDALQRHTAFADRVALVQAHLEARLAFARPADAIDLAAEALAFAASPLRVSTLAARAGCSERQFSRVFTDRTGVAPKLYGRMARFQSLLKAHQQQPDAPLAHLAMAAHYFDQAHFVRDCRAFTSRAPQDFLRRWTPPERVGI